MTAPCLLYRTRAHAGAVYAMSYCGRNVRNGADKMVTTDKATVHVCRKCVEKLSCWIMLTGKAAA